MSMVSVIVPVYNRPGMLERAVHSVVNQTYSTFELVLVDDGSDAATKRVLRDLNARFHSVLRVLEQPNSGVGAARELGRRFAKGSFIQYLDSDDILLPRKFELQVAALESCREADIAYGVVQYIDAQGNILDRSYRQTGLVRKALFPELLRGQWWHTVSPLYRREIVDKVGPWKTLRFAEDWEYEARMAAQCPVLVHVSAPIAQVQKHDETRLTRDTDKRLMVKDRACVFPVVFECAQRVEIDKYCDEMRFFSRWAFLVARQSMEMGFIKESTDCMRVAHESNVSRRIDVSLYYWCLRIFGFVVTRCMVRLSTLVRAT